MPASGFHCATSDQCGAGLCEANGFCSFRDDSCDSGRRFGSYAGDATASCTTPDMIVDSPDAAAPADAAPNAPDAGAPDAYVMPPNLMGDPGFELQASGTLGSPWTLNWQTTNVETGATAHAGTHNLFQSPPAQLSDEAYQQVTVAASTHYTVIAHVNMHKGSTATDTDDAFLIYATGTDGAVLGSYYPAAGVTNGYQTWTFGFNSGARTAVRIWVKTWNDDAPTGNTWLRADDFELRAQ